MGDTLLQRFAKALQERIRHLARFGGDEFVVLARHVDSEAGAIAIADSVHSILGGFQSIGEHPVAVSASIGVCMLVAGPSEAPVDIPMLLRQADSAMYRAKARGTGQTVVAEESDLTSDGVLHRHSGRQKSHPPLTTLCQHSAPDVTVPGVD